MKLSKNFCWETFQRAAMNRELSFYTDGWIYDIIYVADGYMMTNKRRPDKADITNMADGTPLIEKDGEYKPLPQRGTEQMKNNKLENLNKKLLEVIEHLASKAEVAWIEVARINDDGSEDRVYREVRTLHEMKESVSIWETYTKTHPESEIKFHIDINCEEHPYEFDDFSYYTDIIDTGSTILTIAEIIEVFGGIQ